MKRSEEREVLGVGVSREVVREDKGFGEGVAVRWLTSLTIKTNQVIIHSDFKPSSRIGPGSRRGVSSGHGGSRQ